MLLWLAVILGWITLALGGAHLGHILDAPSLSRAGWGRGSSASRPPSGDSSSFGSSWISWVPW